MFPIPRSAARRREVTTAAPQALWALNNEATYRRAQELATRLVREEGDRPEAWVEVALAPGAGQKPLSQGATGGPGAGAASEPGRGRRIREVLARAPGPTGGRAGGCVDTALSDRF